MSRLGVLARVSYLLVLSYVDLVADVYVTEDYWNNGRMKLACALGCVHSVGTCPTGGVDFLSVEGERLGEQ